MRQGEEDQSTFYSAQTVCPYRELLLPLHESQSGASCCFLRYNCVLRTRAFETHLR